MSDALHRTGARQGGVREHEILRVTATIGGKDPTQSIAIARRAVLAWAEKRSGGVFAADAWTGQQFEHLSGGRNCAAYRVDVQNFAIWALRAEEPDKNIPGRIWTTEVVIAATPKQPPRFTVRLLVNTREDNLEILPHVPGFILHLIERCGLYSGPYDIDASPWVVDSTVEVSSLINMLVDPERQLPVFVLSIDDESVDGKPFMNAAELARATAGLGHVAILPAEYTWELSRHLGRQRSAFGGATRVYMPGFASDSNPFSHRLFLAEQANTIEGARQCERWIRSLAATESIRRARLGHEVVPFATIRDASISSQQQRLEREGAPDIAKLEAAYQRIDALERKAEAANAEADFYATEHDSAVQRAEAAEAQLRRGAFRIQQLESQIRAGGNVADDNIVLPNNWAEFVDWCDVNLAGRVVLTPRARNGLRDPLFQDVQAAARCMLWLANDARTIRIEGGGAVNEFIIEDGIRNSHCGGDEFDFDWQGKRLSADWHVKSGGNTRDPMRCLRIYYTWEPETQQIVVAEMPAHRRTSAT